MINDVDNLGMRISIALDNYKFYLSFETGGRNFFLEHASDEYLFLPGNTR